MPASCDRERARLRARSRGEASRNAERKRAFVVAVGVPLLGAFGKAIDAAIAGWDKSTASLFSELHRCSIVRVSNSN